MVFYIEPYQLLCIPYKDATETDKTLKDAAPINYLASECQDCGYVILRRLNTLLGNKVAKRFGDNTPSEDPRS